MKRIKRKNKIRRIFNMGGKESEITYIFDSLATLEDYE